MSGKISDEERWKIVQNIHQEYKQEVRKMKPLSSEEMRQIAEQVHKDYEEVVAKVAKDAEFLNKLAREKAEAKIKQEQEEAQLLREMKPRNLKWFVLFTGFIGLILWIMYTL